MRIFIAAIVGMVFFIVTWALGLTPDVGALIALAFIALGILAEMASRQGADDAEARR